MYGGRAAAHPEASSTAHHTVPAAGFLAAGLSLSAHIPPGGTPDRLRSAIPREIVDQGLKEIDGARTRGLPAGALEHLVLELTAKGAAATDVVHEVTVQHRALWLGREALRAGGRPSPTDGEIEAACAALRKGADDAAIGALAASVPADRSLAVPLSVIASLMERGLPGDDVVAAMHVWLESGATDTELRDLAGPSQRPDLTEIRGARGTRPVPRPLGTGIPHRPSGR
jgi:hypothetical protein